MVTSGVSDEHKEAQLARCIRALLRNPMLDRLAGEVFTHTIQREPELRAWFATNCGWALRVEPEHGYARLRKQPVNAVLPRPLMAARHDPAVPFDRTRYALFCVVAAVLREFPRGQVSLQDLVRRVADRTAVDDALNGYTAEETQRSAMVDVLEEMKRFGVITLVDHRGDYELQADANALYDIDEHRLVDLFVNVAAPDSFTLSGDLETDSLDDELTPAQQRLGRQLMMRRLLDDPVVYTDDLSPLERHWMANGGRQLRSALSKAGLELEIRRDGWCAVDPTGESTDEDFPKTNTILDQATLMICSRLGAETTTLPRWIARGNLTFEVQQLLREHPTWAKRYQQQDGAVALATLVGDRLCAMAMARMEPRGLVLLPALGRFRQVDVRTGQEA
jgi:uncharacterized protein (TIGR02678 family)